DHERPAVRITQDVAVFVIGQHLPRDQIADWSRTAALTVAKKLDQHGGGSFVSVDASARAPAPGAAHARGLAARLIALSIATSRAATTRASMSRQWPASVAAVSQRAIWFRLPPMRPISRTRAGSAVGTGRRRFSATRPRAARIRFEMLPSDASAFANSAAFSAGVQRNTMRASRPSAADACWEA